MKTLEDIKEHAAQFVEDRAWQSFQTPKNLAMALSVEVAELVEHFQWLGSQASRDLDPDTLLAVSDEIADVQLYLVRLADEMGIDILKAVEEKSKKNKKKYPVVKLEE